MLDEPKDLSPIHNLSGALPTPSALPAAAFFGDREETGDALGRAPRPEAS